MESVVIELICLGFDLACFTIFYSLYKKGKKNMEEMKVAPVLEIDKNLKSTITAYENAVIPYAIIKGCVQSKNVPLRSSHIKDVTGVIKKTVVKEYKVIWSPILRLWSETHNNLKNTINIVPFVLKNESSWQKAFVEVEDPLFSEDLPLTIVYDHFSPVEYGFGNNLFGWIRGERTKGFQELEEMLLEGTVLTGVGEIVLENNCVKLKPPTNNLSYFLTNLSKEALIRKLDVDVKLFRVFTIFSSLVGVFLISWITKSLYASWKRRIQSDRDARRREEVRRNRNERSPEERDNIPVCVVCLSNTIEMMILECGHACLCADCADPIARNGYCPVCRATITRIVTAFLP